jgi:hypothetical protein
MPSLARLWCSELAPGRPSLAGRSPDFLCPLDKEFGLTPLTLGFLPLLLALTWVEC